MVPDPVPVSVLVPLPTDIVACTGDRDVVGAATRGVAQHDRGRVDDRVCATPAHDRLIGTAEDRIWPEAGVDDIRVAGWNRNAAASCAGLDDQFTDLAPWDGRDSRGPVRCRLEQIPVVERRIEGFRYVLGQH
jgi:hypothetical protein